MEFGKIHIPAAAYLAGWGAHPERLAGSPRLLLLGSIPCLLEPADGCAQGLRGGPSLPHTPGFPSFYTQTQLQGSVGLPVTNQNPHPITHTTPQRTALKGLLKHLLTERTAPRIAPPLTPRPPHTPAIQPQVVSNPASPPQHMLKEGVKSGKDLEIGQVLSTQK